MAATNTTSRSISWKFSAVWKRIMKKKKKSNWYCSPQTERTPFCEWLRLLSPQHGWGTAVQSTAHTDPFPDQPKVNPQGTSWTKPSITLSWFEPFNSSRAVSSTSELQKHSHPLLTVCSLVSRITTQIKKNHSLHFFPLSSQFYASHSSVFFSQTDWGLTYKVFPHMKAVLHFH